LAKGRLEQASIDAGIEGRVQAHHRFILELLAEIDNLETLPLQRAD
jgi:hypothetical protein